MCIRDSLIPVPTEVSVNFPMKVTMDTLVVVPVVISLDRVVEVPSNALMPSTRLYVVTRFLKFTNDIAPPM